MAKGKNRKYVKESAKIDITKYIDSDPVVAECSGCKKVFTYQGADPLQKCLAYANPASKWPRKGEQFATMLATVRGADGKASSVKEVPIIEKICPLATHVQLMDIINTDSKNRAGQQKQNRG